MKTARDKTLLYQPFLLSKTLVSGNYLGQPAHDSVEVDSKMLGNVLLDAVAATAAESPEAIAFDVGDLTTTYSELWEATCAIARGMSAAVDNRVPVLVYGSKSALTVECFLACLMSGHAYVPIDTELPAQRVADIAGQIEDAVLLAATDVPPRLADACTAAMQLDACALLDVNRGAVPLSREGWVAGEDIQYIIFTSGSTGRPKGIEVTEANVAGFRRWLAQFPVVRTGGRVFLDQAHYSFDLSGYELVGALTTGGHLHALPRGANSDFRLLFDDLAESDIEVWVSTPSFADMCLADPAFNEHLLPHVRLFLFCGEALHHITAARLRERFPAAIVANTYGPTESTVAVTYCEIGERELTDERSLPVGMPREGTELRIVDHETGTEMPCGEVGEIVIAGDTVAWGYYRQPEKTAQAFFATTMRDGTPARAYRTGDLGYIDEAGMLYCAGRLDSLVKVNGYRIELGEVEGALGAISCVRHAAVVPATRCGRVTSLCAFAVVDPAVRGDDFATARDLKAQLAHTLPSYMVPRQVRVLAEMPLNTNGKADRKALAASVSR